MLDILAKLFASVPSEIYVFIISMLPIVELRGSIPTGALLELPFYLNYIISVFGNILPVPFILLFIPKILEFLARFKIFRPMVEWLHKKASKNSAKVLGEKKEIEKKGGASTNPAGDSEGNFANGFEGNSANGFEGNSEVYATADKAVSASADNEGKVAYDEYGEIVASGLGDVGESNFPHRSTGEESGKDTKSEKRGMSLGIFLALMLFVAIPFPATGAWTGSLIAALFELPKKKAFLAILIGVLISGTIMTLASYGIIGFFKIFL